MLDEAPTRPSWYHYVLYLVGVAGLAFAIASVWLGMRAVMNIGGYCASGGPYEIDVQCPDGIDVIMFLAFPLGFISAGLMVWAGGRLHGAWAGLVGLAWPALFLSLGYNFLEYGLRPPDGSSDIVWGWLIPGIIFIVMGAVPLIGVFATGGDHTMVVPGLGAQPTPRDMKQLRRNMLEASKLAASSTGTPPPPVTVDRAEAPTASGGLVDQLERLATLRDSGRINDDEYDQAKRALLAAAASGA
jgi:hypothetical protein